MFLTNKVLNLHKVFKPRLYITSRLLFYPSRELHSDPLISTNIRQSCEVFRGANTEVLYPERR
jgi:hypothetical protein